MVFAGGLCLPRGAGKVQRKQFLQQRLVVRGGVPAVGGKGRLVQPLVGQIEPGGAFVVEGRQCAFGELFGGGVIAGDKARVPDRADAVGVGVVQVPRPRAVGRGGDEGRWRGFAGSILAQLLCMQV